MTLDNTSLFVSLLSSGLAAGLLVGWLVSVLPGLARVGDHTYVSTMRTINRAIINPAFLATFLFPPLVLGAAALINLGDGWTARPTYLAAAAVTYLVGVLGVTMAGNVPLNNSLDRFDPAAATDGALAERRRTYEDPWNRWHATRTLASVVALGLTAAAAIVDGTPT